MSKVKVAEVGSNTLFLISFLYLYIYSLYLPNFSKFLKKLKCYCYLCYLICRYPLARRHWQEVADCEYRCYQKLPAATQIKEIHKRHNHIHGCNVPWLLDSVRMIYSRYFLCAVW